MCTMVLKLRNLYKWEKEIQPWDEPEPADLLDWIEAKENYWQTIAGKSYIPLANGKDVISPHDLEKVNGALDNKNLHYGAGYGRSLKTIFFLAEKIEQRRVKKCTVVILGKEMAREMASPFAMTQDGFIIIRKEALRYFFWDQIQELHSSRRSSFRHAIGHYGLLRDGKLNNRRIQSSLNTMVEEELNLFIYHEVGEMLQKELDSKTLQLFIGHFPGSIIEFVCRAVKDILADTHPQGPISYVIREQRESSLGFYIGFLDGIREKLFPEIFKAWQLFLDGRDWHHIDQARTICWKRNFQVAQRIKTISHMIGVHPDEQIMSRFNSQVLLPLGLEKPKGAEERAAD